MTPRRLSTPAGCDMIRRMAIAKTTKGKSSGDARGSARKRLTPAGEQRGLDAADIVLDLENPELTDLIAGVRAAGGAPIGAYREPLSGKALLVAALPIGAVEPTPFQRDLSPAHTKRLAQKIEESGSFLDPLIVVRGVDGRLWTPNGRHRLAAAKVLGLKQITALVSPDEALAFRILALNTEKAHNLKDRSLEVIRMARELARRDKSAKETDFTAELEDAALLTLGLCYLENRQFAGAAYHPFLRKLDRFSTKPLSTSLREREGCAARLMAIDADVKRIIGELQKRGFKSPYLRTYVVARINPVRFHRAKKGDTAPPMPLPAGLTRMAASARKFDVASVRERDLALVAAVAADEP
jgi:ParB family chromosome partitioning protein